MRTEIFMLGEWQEAKLQKVNVLLIGFKHIQRSKVIIV